MIRYVYRLNTYIMYMFCRHWTCIPIISADILIMSVVREFTDLVAANILCDSYSSVSAGLGHCADHTFGYDT